MTDAELLEFAREFRIGILGGRPSRGMCFMVCAPLVTLLQMHGVDCEMIETFNGYCNHVWIRLADDRALDPTADQFNELFAVGLPEVYLGPPGPYQGFMDGEFHEPLRD